MPDCTDPPPRVMRGLRLLAGVTVVLVTFVVVILVRT